MAHKVMTGGTVYEVSGGRAVAGGTVYSLAKGRTLADGTIYEIPFSRDYPVELTISGTTNSEYAYVMVDDEKLIETGSRTILKNSKTKLQVYVSAAIITGNCEIMLNNVQVQKGSGLYTLETDANKITVLFKKVGQSMLYAYTAEITTS